MKLIILLIFLVSYHSCKDKKHSDMESMKLTIVHDECSGCLEAVIVDSNFKFPDSISKNIDNPNSKFLMLAGKNPFKGKSITNDIFNFEIEITGYFQRIDSINNPVGRVPVFYVQDWKKLIRNHK